MGHTLSQTRVLNEGNRGHACLSVESLKDKTTYKLDRTEQTIASYFVQAPDIPRKDGPFGTSLCDVGAEPTSHASNRGSKYLEVWKSMQEEFNSLISTDTFTASDLSPVSSLGNE